MTSRRKKKNELVFPLKKGSAVTRSPTGSPQCMISKMATASVLLLLVTSPSFKAQGYQRGYCQGTRHFMPQHPPKEVQCSSNVVGNATRAFSDCLKFPISQQLIFVYVHHMVPWVFSLVRTLPALVKITYLVCFFFS